MAKTEVGQSARRGVEIGGGRSESDKVGTDRKDWLPRGTLSFSALSCYAQCRRKFWHKYVAKTPKDPDAVWDPVRFSIGKCFHEILEDTKHKPDFPPDWPTTTGMKYRRKYQLSPFDMAKIVAMLIRYRKFHEASGLLPVAHEVMVFDDTIGGFIDSVMVDPVKKEWWVLDDKTAVGMRKGLKESMRRNLQLSIYAALRDKLKPVIDKSEHASLCKRFAGVIYRCSLKPSIKFDAKKDANFWLTVGRCTTETYEIRVPVEQLEIDTMFSEVKETCRAVNMEKATGKKLPRNLEACLAYGDTCEFWSQCYGETATDCRNSAIVVSLKTETSTEFDDLL